MLAPFGLGLENLSVPLAQGVQGGKVSCTEFTRAPDGHMWAEDLAAQARQDLDTIIWLCEQEIIQGVRIQERWAVRVVRTTNTQAGAAIVWGLKLGGEISIGSVIGQYVTIIDNKARVRDRSEFVAQEPIRDDIDKARQWIRWSWYALAGGFALMFAFIVVTWPIASLLILPGYNQSKAALERASKHGDNALIEEASSVYNQARITATILWGVLVIAIFIGLVVAISGA